MQFQNINPRQGSQVHGADSFRSIMANNIKPKGAEEALFNCMHIKFKTGYEFYGYNIQDFLFRSPP